MAKSAKPKAAAKKEEVIENPKEETVEVGITSAELTSEAEVVEIPKSEAIKDGLVKEETKPVITPVEPLDIEVVKETIKKWEGGEELSMEQKIINFMEDKSGEVRLNDFLKSLFGLPKPYEPAQWLNQGANRLLRATLEKLSKDGLLTIKDNAHMKLGSFYYPDSTTGKTEYHNLNTVKVFATK